MKQEEASSFLMAGSYRVTSVSRVAQEQMDGYRLEVNSEDGLRVRTRPSVGGPAITGLTANKRSETSGQTFWFRLVVVVLLFFTMLGSMMNWITSMNWRAQGEEDVCLNLIYDFEGNTNTDLNDLDRQRADLHDCDLNDLLDQPDSTSSD